MYNFDLGSFPFKHPVDTFQDPVFAVRFSCCQLRTCIMLRRYVGGGLCTGKNEWGDTWGGGPIVRLLPFPFDHLAGKKYPSEVRKRYSFEWEDIYWLKGMDLICKKSVCTKKVERSSLNTFRTVCVSALRCHITRTRCRYWLYRYTVYYEYGK